MKRFRCLNCQFTWNEAEWEEPLYEDGALMCPNCLASASKTGGRAVAEDHAPAVVPPVPWPTDVGIWRGFVEGGIGWFPLQTLYLRDDLPTGEEMAREAAGEVMPPRRVLAVVAQWLESETSWPYTFQQCHPVKQWRRPTEQEMARAQVFYGKS